MTNPDPDPFDAPTFSGKHARAVLGLLLMIGAPVLLYLHGRDSLTGVEAIADGGMFVGGLFLSNQRSAWKDLGGWIVELVKAVRGGGGA